MDPEWASEAGEGSKIASDRGEESREGGWKQRRIQPLCAIALHHLPRCCPRQLKQYTFAALSRLDFSSLIVFWNTR